MLKKVFLIFLIQVYLFNVAGYFLYYSVMKIIIQKEIKCLIRKGLKEEELSILVLTINEFNSFKWVELYKEFVINDEMFDVVKIIKTEKNVYIKCINDKKEQRLISNFNKKNKTVGKSNKIINKILKTKYLTILMYNNKNLICNNINYILELSHFKSVDIKCPNPPPEAFFI